jgi:hypothetical protein
VPQPLQLVHGDALPALDEQLVEGEVARDDGAARTRDDVGADLGQAALREVLVTVVQGPSDGELENAVPEELEPLVGRRPVGRPRGMREDVVEPLSRETVDQPAEVTGGGMATGAR